MPYKVKSVYGRFADSEKFYFFDEISKAKKIEKWFFRQGHFLAILEAQESKESLIKMFFTTIFSRVRLW